MKRQYSCIIILLLLGLYQDVSQATSCNERGRFPNDENADCRGYIMCLAGGITNFTEYKLVCPVGSIYSHIEQQCTNATNYKCYPNFNCTTVGNFVYPENDNCTSYLSCVQGMNDVSTARLVDCPENTTFDSTVRDCVDKRQSVCNTSKVNISMVNTSMVDTSGIVTLATSHDIVTTEGIPRSNYAVSNSVSCLTIILFISFELVVQ